MKKHQIIVHNKIINIYIRYIKNTCYCNMQQIFNFYYFKRYNIITRTCIVHVNSKLILPIQAVSYKYLLVQCTCSNVYLPYGRMFQYDLDFSSPLLWFFKYFIIYLHFFVRKFYVCRTFINYKCGYPKEKFYKFCI